MNKFYSLEQHENEADIYIFGDITSWVWDESDVSSFTLSKELQEITADTINVHINSYGGEVAEGLAIYNMLRNHKAKVVTYCDGFACSVASVIFMAGDERIMNNASLLMIHNAWMYTMGNPDQLRKDADDLEVINQASINAYMDSINISQEELEKLLDSETWLLPNEALEMGFATSIVAIEESQKAVANVHKALFSLMSNAIKGSEVKEPVIEPVEEIVEEVIEEEIEETPKAEEPKEEENKVLNMLHALLGGEGK